MERQIATVGIDGQLVLPAEVQCALGILPRSRVGIEIRDELVEIPLQERRRLTDVDAKFLIHELSTMFLGEPSLEDEYFRDRDLDKW